MQQQHPPIWPGRSDRPASLDPRLDSLIALPPARRATLLRAADPRTLALALMGAGADLLRCVAESVPALWPLLCEQAELLTFPRRVDVEWAQQLLQTWSVGEK